MSLLEAFGVTVAVKVTDWPNTDGFAELLVVVVVARRAGTASLTTCTIVGDEELAKLLFPEKVAPIVCDPGSEYVTVQVA